EQTFSIPQKLPCDLPRVASIVAAASLDTVRPLQATRFPRIPRLATPATSNIAQRFVLPVGPTNHVPGNQRSKLIPLLYPVELRLPFGPAGFEPATHGLRSNL